MVLSPGDSSGGDRAQAHLSSISSIPRATRMRAIRPVSSFSQMLASTKSTAPSPAVCQPRGGRDVAFYFEGPWVLLPDRGAAISG